VYTIKQHINRTHMVNIKKSVENLYTLAHLILVFFAELPTPLLDALPLDNIVLDDKHSNEPFLSLAPEAMALFVWMLDLMTDVIKNSQHNHVQVRHLVDQFAPCVHDQNNVDKLKRLLVLQLSQSCNITANSQRTASIQQITNHFKLKKRIGHLVPSQSFHGPVLETRPDFKRDPSNLSQPEGEGTKLPDGWKMYTTKSPRRRIFYHNAELSRTQWHPPGEDAQKVLPPGWTIHRTKTPRKRVFYHNKDTGASIWHFPDS